jgi:hypothetical protein
MVGGDINLNYLPHPGASAYYEEEFGFRLVLDSAHTNFPTIIRRAANSTLNNYLGAAGYDNIAIRTGADLRPHFPYSFNVYDRVNRTAPTMMFNPVQTIANLQAPEPQNTVFRLQQNFKYMGPVPGVSDHLPVFLSF